MNVKSEFPLGSLLISMNQGHQKAFTYCKKKITYVSQCSSMKSTKRRLERERCHEVVSILSGYFMFE